LKENMPETLLSITMQLVCKIKSEIIIIIIDTMPQSATTVKPMEIKKHCFFCTNVTHTKV
jgi:hypothetical protein